jgi:hypothetical protein
VVTRPAQQCIVRTALGPYLSGTLRTDPEIDRAHRELFGW